MTTKVIFNIDKNLKEKAMKKARKQGLTFSAVLNMATRAYIADEIEIGAFERDLELARADVRAGRVFSQEEVMRRLNIR